LISMGVVDFRRLRATYMRHMADDLNARPRAKEWEWVRPLPDTAPPAGPFTVAWLHEKMQFLENRYCRPPDHELAHIASLLNMINDACKARGTAATNRAHAAKVHYAFWTLVRFFDARRRASEAPGVDRQIVENERRLCHQFEILKEMMAATPFELKLDTGVQIPPFENWHTFVQWVARAFQWALQDSNPKKTVGFSDDGPAVRLTMEALDVIAGGDPKLRPKSRGVLGQHLRAHL
jgi:hypothetical protein